MANKEIESIWRTALGENRVLDAWFRLESRESVVRSEVVVQQAKTIRPWLKGLDLFETAIGYLNDANLRPGRDDALILRGELLAIACDHCRVALDALLTGYYPSLSALTCDLFACRERVAWVRLDPDSAFEQRVALLRPTLTSKAARRIRKQNSRAIRDYGTDLDREFSDLAQTGRDALREPIDPVTDPSALNGRIIAAHFHLGPTFTKPGFLLGAKWGMIAIAMLLREIQQLGLMNTSWREQLIQFEAQLSTWLTNHPS